MKQALVRKGIVIGKEVPAPCISDGSLLIKTVNSCISAGTEMSSVSGSGMSLIKRALKQPDNVRKVIENAKNKGIANAVSKVKGELDSGKPTGYSLSGVVIGVGKGAEGFSIGDHVTASGSGIANHAEFVDVPVNLATKIPNDMNFVDASTVTLGAIALQGIRRTDLRMGELVVVFGVGILGLLAVQMLKVAGIRVAAVDIDPERLNLALESGAEIAINSKEEDAVKSIVNWSGGQGADAVLFTAATSSSQPLSSSFKMCRKKGRVVLVGVVGMEIDRADIFKKEIDFMISSSYGPGRYDDNYEQKGIDYPFAYVRWTQNRNMQEYLRLVYKKEINIEKLVTQIYSIDKVTDAYNSLKQLENKPLMVILDYGKPEIESFNSLLNHERKVIVNDRIINKKLINVALIGAGGFAVNNHLLNIKSLDNKFKLHCVVDKSGSTAKSVAARFDAKYATTNVNEALSDNDVDLVLIATRHDSHAGLVLESLRAGKNVFVEKPLATTMEELNSIQSFYSSCEEEMPLLMVGFNRRFSKYAIALKNELDKRVNPVIARYRMNAGFIPLDHWVHENGGRIVGEACHIIDLLVFLIGSKVNRVSVESLTPQNDKYSSSDNKSIILKFDDGSLGHIDYFATGAKDLPKEYMDIHFDGKTLILDDYKNLTGYGISVNKIESKTSQKGHFEEMLRLHETLVGNMSKWPVPLEEMFHTTSLSLLI